jgi:hypothetical protein
VNPSLPYATSRDSGYRGGGGYRAALPPVGLALCSKMDLLYALINSLEVVHDLREWRIDVDELWATTFSDP